LLILTELTLLRFDLEEPESSWVKPAALLQQGPQSHTGAEPLWRRAVEKIVENKN
jgi:hypothetical protein